MRDIRWSGPKRQNRLREMINFAGWGTWIRTRTNGVRVRGSTVNLFPKKMLAALAGAGRHIVEFHRYANP